MQDSGASDSQVPPFTCIVAVADGSAFAADANGVDYQLTSEDPDTGTGTWTPLTSSVALTRLAATSASDVWGLDGTGAVYRSQGPSWNPVAVPGGQALDQISAAADGTVWGVSSGVAYQYSGTGFVAQGQASCTAVAVGGAGGVFALASSGDADVLMWDGSAWGSFYPTPPVPLTCLSASDDGMLWGVGTDGNLYVSVGAPGEWTAVGSGLSQVSAASASYIWALDTTGAAQALQYGSPLLAEDAPISAGTAGWDTESVFDQSQSTHLWLVYQAASLAGAQGGSGGQAASNLVKPQDFGVKGPIGDAFHDSMCHGLRDADFNDPWRDFSGLWGKIGQSTYKSHFYDPDTGNNWKGESDPTALTRGRGTATMALDCYAAGDLASAGYYLGVALHYLTDSTQAMHAQNFTWLSSRPFGWHTAYEERAMKLTGSGSLQVNPNYIAPSADTELDWFYVTAATNAKQYLTAICPPIVYQPSPPLDRWPDQADQIFATSLGSTEAMLADAIEVTAQFLVAWTALAENRQNEVVCFVSADTGGLITSNGNWLNQWPFEGSGAQKWWAIPLSGADEGYYQIAWFSPDSHVLEASGQNAGSGVQVSGWNGGDSQKWKIVEGELGQIRLQGKQSGLFLTINQAQTPDSGLLIQSGPPSGAGPEGQNWVIVPWEPGALGCTAGSLVADVQGNSKKALAPLELYTPNQQPNQTFLFVPVQQDQSAPDEQVFVILIANQGMAVDVTSSFGVVQNPWSGANSQRWSRVDVGDANTFMLENVANPGDAITVQGDGTQTEELLGLAGGSGQAQQLWTLITPISQLPTATFPAEARKAEGAPLPEKSATHASPA
jgi:Tectonin domain/Ricin-type beta-trefoil lectin domain-like